MKFCHKKLTQAGLLLITASILSLTTSAFQQQAQTAQPQPKPIAHIQTILINGEKVAEANQAALSVTRAKTHRVEQGRTGMPLYAGDEVMTDRGAQVELLFNGNNQVFLDPYTRVRVGSLFTYWGSWFASLRNAFDARTKKVRLGNRGTEYALTVNRDGSCRLIVLEGIATVQRTDSLPRVESRKGNERRAGSTEEVEADKQEISVGKKQEAIVPSDQKSAIKLRPASEDEVRRILYRRNEFILTYAPAQFPRRIIPNFASSIERNNAFKEAKFEAFLNETPQSYETLGNVYNDWGQSAQAIEAYDKAVQGRQTIALLANLAEAYRTAQLFKAAQQQVDKALKIEQWTFPELSRLWNAQGNIYLDQAIAVRDNDRGLAKKYLAAAERAFSRAFQYEPEYPEPETLDARNMSKGIIQNNLGETYLTWAEIELQENHLSDAREHYTAAKEAFETARKFYPDYPYISSNLEKTLQVLSFIPQPKPEASPSPEAETPKPKPSQAVLPPPVIVAPRELQSNELELYLGATPSHDSQGFSWAAMVALVVNHMKGERLSECDVLSRYNRRNTGNSNTDCCSAKKRCITDAPPNGLSSVLSDRFGVLNQSLARPLLYDEITRQIDDGRPIIAKFVSSDGIGHFTIIAGYERPGKVLIYQPNDIKHWFNYQELSSNRLPVWAESILLTNRQVGNSTSKQIAANASSSEDLIDALLKEDKRAIGGLISYELTPSQAISNWKDLTRSLDEFQLQDIPEVSRQSISTIYIRCVFQRSIAVFSFHFNSKGQIIAFEEMSLKDR